MKRLLFIPFALVALVAGTMYWSGAASADRADFAFINRGDIKTLDLVRMSYMQDIRMAYGLWEGLYTLDPRTLEPIPGCAFPIDISEDRKVYTFHIRGDAKWSNGEPVRSTDFIYAWKRMSDESGDYADLLGYIVGIKDYQRRVGTGEHPDFSRVGVEAIDERTLRVRLENPTPFFPDLCAFPPLFPANEASRQDPKNPGSPRADFTRPPFLVTNGPYKLATWEFKRRLRLVKNEFYWNRDSVKCRTIDMIVMEKPQSELAAYDHGEVDWISDMGNEFGAKLLASGRKDLKVFNGFGTYFYSFNCNEQLPGGERNPFHDPRVRRALSMAVDKGFIVRELTRMGEPAATNYIPPGVFANYESPRGLEFDVSAARALMSEAGYPEGRGFPVIRINFNNEGAHRDIAEYLQRQWKNNLNVEMVLEGKELKVFGEQLRNKQYDISRASWIGDYNDPSTFTDKYLSTSGNNDSGWVNAKYDELCAAAARESNPSARLKLFNQAEAILLQEAPILPLYHYVNSYMVHDNVKGLPLNPRNMVMFQGIEVSR